MKIRVLVFLAIAGLLAATSPVSRVAAQASQCVKNRTMSESDAWEKVNNYLTEKGWQSITYQTMTPEQIEAKYLCTTVQWGFYVSGKDGKGKNRSKVTFVITKEGRVGY